MKTGVLFDLDGVLIDSESIYILNFGKMLTRCFQQMCPTLLT